MNFVHPWFLTALTALAIPVIIHLFSFRRYKRIHFPNVRFLKELKEETRSYKRIKHLLILLMRLLALAFLVFAFAQPFIPVEKTANVVAGNKSVHLFIDNSFSMQSVGKSSSILEEAKRSATDVIRSHKASDQFQILTNDFEGKHQRYYSKDEALELVNSIEISPVSRTTEDVIRRQKDLIHAKKSTNASLFIFSDFQRSSIAPEKIEIDSNIALNLIPVQPQAVRNIFIDSAWFSDPVRRTGKKEDLNIRIRNSSTEDLESVPVKLFLNGIQKGLSSVNLAAGGSKDTVISFVAGDKGIQQCKLQLADYPVSFDDAFYFSYTIPETINITAINGNEENPYLTSLLGSDSSFRFNNISEKQLDYSSLKEKQLVILNDIPSLSTGLAEELNKFMENGGSVLLIPSETENKGYNEFLNQYAIQIDKSDTTKTIVQQLVSEHPIFTGVFEKKPENVDLPEVRKHYKIIPSSKSGIEYLMKLPDGSPFMAVRKTGKGKLYISASAFTENSSSFVKHALFVPLIYNIALFSTPSSPLYYTIGKEEAINISYSSIGNEQVYRVKSDTGKFESIPELRKSGGAITLYMHNSIRNAGNYKLYLGNETKEGISFNYDRKESEMSYYTPSELSEAIKDPAVHVLDISDGKASVALEELSEGKKLWKLCLILTLLFILGEILIIKLWKNEGPVKVSADR